MDKRTRLAMLIIAVILGVQVILTTYLQQRRQAEVRARAHADSLAAAARGAEVPEPVPGRVAASPAAPPGATAPAAEDRPDTAAAMGAIPFATATGGEGDLVIETPLERIRIARAGAVLDEITLLKFRMAGDTTRVNLVPPHFAAEPAAKSLGLVLRTPRGDWDLSRARFDPMEGDWKAEGGTLRLAADAPPCTLRLRTLTADGGAVVKRFVFDPRRYDFQMDLQVEPRGELRAVESYTLVWSTGMPVTEKTQDDLASFKTSALVGRDLVRRGLSGRFGRQAGGPEVVAGSVRWTAMQSKYFIVAFIPSPAQNGTVQLDTDRATQWMSMRFTQPTPWRTGSDSYRVYAGPIVYRDILDLGVGLESEVNLGYRWVRPLSSLILRFMLFLHRGISNYGVIIILISVLAKLVFWPLTEKSFRSMRRMQDLQPLMEEIRRRYKDQPQEMNRQVMALYKERKVNPMGGCMPLLVQSPVLIALYSALSSSIELRNAPFVGYIDNLAAPDVLYRLPHALPLIGDNISLLPVVMAGTTVLQTKLGATMTPAGGPAAQQQLIMKWVMPIMLFVLFYKMPSGLMLYWIVNTVMSIAQQIQINHKLGPAPVVRAAAVEGEGRRSHAAPDRGDRAEHGRGSAARPGRAGGKSR